MKWEKWQELSLIQKTAVVSAGILAILVIAGIGVVLSVVVAWSAAMLAAATGLSVIAVLSLFSPKVIDQAMVWLETAAMFVASGAVRISPTGVFNFNLRSLKRDSKRIRKGLATLAATELQIKERIAALEREHEEGMERLSFAEEYGDEDGFLEEVQRLNPRKESLALEAENLREILAEKKRLTELLRDKNLLIEKLKAEGEAAKMRMASSEAIAGVLRDIDGLQDGSSDRMARMAIDHMNEATRRNKGDIEAHDIVASLQQSTSPRRDPTQDKTKGLEELRRWRQAKAEATGGTEMPVGSLNKPEPTEDQPRTAQQERADAARRATAQAAAALKQRS